MIIEFRVKNFLSIKDEQVLSFEADSNTDYEKYFVTEIGGYRLLKVMGIYGANASGKSNILKALDKFLEIGLKSRYMGDNLARTTFSFNSDYDRGNSQLGMDFLIEDSGKFIKYRYEIIYNVLDIVSEKLEYYPNSRPALVYERVQNIENPRGFDFKVPKSMKLKNADKDAIELNTLRNTSVLSSFSRINPIFPQAKKVYNYFSSYLKNTIKTNLSLKDESMNYFEKSYERRNILTELFQKADFDISDVQILNLRKMAEFGIYDHKKEYQAAMDSIMVKETSVFDQYLSLKYDIPKFETYFIHTYQENGEYKSGKLPLSSESLGMVQFFGLAYPLIHALVHPSVLLIDEIENSLHLEIVKYIIMIFLSNATTSQMLFTTQNLLLLDGEIMRKDAIWFTQKQKDGSTELYSLTDFTDLNRSNRNYLKSYLAGNFGAVPDIYQFKLDLDSLKKSESKI
ncbi:hypothetical protein MsAg5_08800 [Methanosarcinaceae archaeon Ag5]|uniref:ATPase AAA-type core domain-containing protein n=1 Tax=Methanolapillus africanus TaxID=3028297 RepID=A0AAE4MI55_9EURY|nr:hypothetical protein [Methanosarcinaceae archaeon Ag5]